MKQKKICFSAVCAVAMGGIGYASAAGTIYELTPVVVTANRLEQKLVNADADISVVTRDDIEEFHMGTVEEALRTMPGMQFLNYGANGTNSNLSGVRINGSKDIVVLVDGVRVTDFQGANNSGYMYSSALSNIDGIERIELLRGGGGVLYGSSARGGVINIITRNPKTAKSTADFSVGEGARRDFRVNTAGGTDDGKLTYNAYFRKYENGDVTDGEGKIWPGHKKSISAGMKLDYDITDQHNMFFNYERISSNWNGNDYVYKNMFAGGYESNSFTVQDKIDWEHFSNRFTFRRSHVLAGYVQKYYDGHIPYWPPSNDFIYTFFSDQITFQDLWNELVMGIEYSHGKSNGKILVKRQYNPDTGDREFIYGYPEEKNWSFYIHEGWTFAPGWTISGGFRHDRPEPDAYSPKYKPHTAKSYKLSWEFTKKDTLYAGHEDYFILPGLDTRYAAQYGNPEVQPAYGWTRSVGYSHEFSDSAAFTFSWFHTKAERTIGIGGAYNPDTGKWEWDSKFTNGQGYSRGWNAQFLYRINSHWDLDLGWSHLHTENVGDTFSEGYSPKNMMTFRVTYNNKKFTAGLDGFYFDRRVNPRHADVQGWPDNRYAVCNLSLNYVPTSDTTLYMKVENVFDKLWAEHTDVIWNHVPGSWYAMPGRIISIGIKKQF